MRNITDILARYLSDINLPSVSIIDIIEIILITFFVYQFMVWIKFTRAYTLLKGLLVNLNCERSWNSWDRKKSWHPFFLLILAKK